MKSVLQTGWGDGGAENWGSSDFPDGSSCIDALDFVGIGAG